MGRSPLPHGMLHGIDAHTRGDGVELADGAVIDIVSAEEIGVRAHIAVSGDTVVTQLYELAEFTVVHHTGGVDQRLFRRQLF